ncbi:hypothetical protein Rhal01_02189 [Rubritalea halochordaticola]|uniref:Uncharacterized protein n=1 Tax=Rubritalea halochordaticola TaxID=714537 RepID=A0ABP9UZZ1_9BACT
MPEKSTSPYQPPKKEVLAEAPEPSSFLSGRRGKILAFSSPPLATLALQSLAHHNPGLFENPRDIQTTLFFILNLAAACIIMRHHSLKTLIELALWFLMTGLMLFPLDLT